MKTLYTVKQKNNKNDSGMVFSSRKKADRYMRFVRLLSNDGYLYDIQETQIEDDGVPVVIMDVDTGQIVRWHWDTPYNREYPRTQPYRDRRVVVFPVTLMNDYPNMVQQAERLYAEWQENQ